MDKNSVGIKVRDRITKAHQEVLMSPEFHRVKVIYDVDPNSWVNGLKLSGKLASISIFLHLPDV